MSELVFLYVPTQDRILLEFASPKKETSLWLTRAISKKMVMDITGIATTSDSKQLSTKEKVMRNDFERDIAQSRAPIKRRKEKLDDQFLEKIAKIENLVQQFEIKAIENSEKFNYEILFLDNAKVLLKMKTDKQHLLNFQTTLIRKIELAKW